MSNLSLIPGKTSTWLWGSIHFIFCLIQLDNILLRIIEFFFIKWIGRWHFECSYLYSPIVAIDLDLSSSKMEVWESEDKFRILRTRDGYVRYKTKFFIYLYIHTHTYTRTQNTYVCIHTFSKSTGKVWFLSSFDQLSCFILFHLTRSRALPDLCDQLLAKMDSTAKHGGKVM